MNGTEVLQRVEQGYRMPKPSSDRFECTEVLYDMMLKTWDRNPEARPTFAFLYSFFDDYFVSAEPNYRDTFWSCDGIENTNSSLTLPHYAFKKQDGWPLALKSWSYKASISPELCLILAQCYWLLFIFQSSYNSGFPYVQKSRQFANQVSCKYSCPPLSSYKMRKGDIGFVPSSPRLSIRLP